MRIVDSCILSLAKYLAPKRTPLASVEVLVPLVSGTAAVSEHPGFQAVLSMWMSNEVLVGEGETQLIEAMRCENRLYSVSCLGRFAWGATKRTIVALAKAGQVGDMNWGKVMQAFGGIEVAVDATGMPVLVSGIVPLALAKALGLEVVAAKVVRRELEWDAFRAHLLAFAAESLDEEIRIKKDLSHYGGRLYQQAYHFDTLDIPHVYGRERVFWITQHIQPGLCTLLDIGANYGLFCMEFEKLGMECTAVELKADDLLLMRKLRDACRARFSIVEGSIFDFNLGGSLKYDVVLALFIFHHFLKTPELHESLIRLLNRLECKQMFLGVHDPGEAQMQGAFRNYGAEEFARFVITHTGLRDFEIIQCPGLGNRVILNIY